MPEGCCDSCEQPSANLHYNFGLYLCPDCLVKLHQDMDSLLEERKDDNDD